MTTGEPSVVIMAKAPVAGRVKTRMCPPLSLEHAASLAEAMLADTMAAAATASCARRVIALDGAPGPWLSGGFQVVPQRGPDLAARLAAAFQDVGAPALAIDADTPQVTGPMLDSALSVLMDPGLDAVLGRTPDGGYWAVGLRRTDSRVFEGVLMSTPQTATEQARRLASLGLKWAELPALRDVDSLEDAIAVAAETPGSHFAALVDSLALEGMEPGREKGKWAHR